jgi:hypothetical protein
MQSDERGAVGFDFVVKLAADILKNSFPWKSHVNNKKRKWSRQRTDLHVLRIRYDEFG